MMKGPPHSNELVVSTASNDASCPRHAEHLRVQRRLVARAQARVKEDEKARRDIIDSWRQLPAIPSADDYARELVERPFEGEVPHAPDEVGDEQAFREAVEAEMKKRRRGGKWGRIVLAVLMFPCVFGGVGASLQSFIGGWSMLAALVAYVGFVMLCTVPYRRETRSLAESAFKEHWPEYWRSINADHEEYVAWPESERQRTEWARKVLAGDTGSVEQSIVSELEELDFPFETACQVHVPDAERAFLVLDLPEIENVIPEVKLRALPDGTVEEVRRTAVGRNEDYVELVSGLGLLLARMAFVSGPTLRQVTVAAFTQRRQPGSGVMENEFVYEARFEREAAASWDSASVEPMRVLNTRSSRYDVRHDKSLNRIHPPDWWQEPAEA
ncbi:hypothetical protein ACLESO_15965 [Pyxidicoccus sp. 3LG]